MRSGFGHLLLCTLHCLHSVHPTQDSEHHIIAPRVGGLLARHGARLVRCAWGSRGVAAALLHQVAKQFLPEFLLTPLELQGSLLLHLHPAELLLLLASAGLQLLKTRQLLLLTSLLLPLQLLPLSSLFLLLLLLLVLERRRTQWRERRVRETSLAK